MPTKENRRVKMTKKILKESFLEMLKTHDIYHISIRELCENADINRSTFYKHYNTQYDLLNDMENDILIHVENRLAGAEINYHERMISLLRFIEENIELCRILINYNVDPEFPQKLLYLPSIKKILDNNITSDNSKFGHEKAQYFYECVVNGGFSMVKRWINKDTRESVEDMSEIILSFFYKTIFPEK